MNLKKKPGRLVLAGVLSLLGLTETIYANWCTHLGSSLHRADVNGDGRPDLVCKDNGRILVDYADQQNFFAGTDYHVDTHYCTHSGSRFGLEDINRDGRADMICYEPDGRIWVDLVDSNGRFDAYSEYFGERAFANWCTHSGSTLHRGDVNGDGRIDRVCKDNGRIWVDYADQRNQFGDTDYYVDTIYCTHSGSRFGLEDITLDGRADMVCYEPDGRIWVDVVDSNGRFNAYSEFFGKCGVARDTRFTVPRDITQTGGHATESGQMSFRIGANLAGNNHARPNLITYGFSDSADIPVIATSHGRIIDSFDQIWGPPFLGWGEVGTEVIMELKDGRGNIVCSASKILKKQGWPGFDATGYTPREPFDLTCNGKVLGNYSIVTQIHGWAAAGGAIHSENHVEGQLNSIERRECRRSR